MQAQEPLAQLVLAVIGLPGTEADAAAVHRFRGRQVVVAGHHTEWGEVPVVVTTQRPELETLRRAVGARLAPEARPDRVVTVDALPLLPSGKPDRLAISRLVNP